MVKLRGRCDGEDLQIVSFYMTLYVYICTCVKIWAKGVNMRCFIGKTNSICKSHMEQVVPVAREGRTCVKSLKKLFTGFS